MFKRTKISLVISVFLHSLLIFLLWFNLPVNTPEKSNQETTYLEIRENTKPASYDSFSARMGRSKKAFSLAPSWKSFSSENKFGVKDSDGDGLSDNPEDVWGAGSGQLKRIESFGLMNKVYELADGALFYPGVLARHKIQGTVNSRLVLRADGNCDWKRTKISSIDSHLRVFILGVLKNVCQQNFEHYMGGKKLANVDLSFRFAITEYNDKNDLEIKEKEQKIIGNVLLFYRNAQHSIMEWELGPFKGVFPLPFVNLNFVWITENWDRIINGVDPLKNYKESS